MADPDLQGKQLASVPNILKEERGSRAPQDKRNHTSLIDVRHILQLANIPRSIWEEATAIINEGLFFRHYCLTEAEIADGQSWLEYQVNWVSGLFTTSQSIGGHQGELMVRGMGADKAWEAKQPASSVTGSSDSGKPEPKKRGWLG